MLLQIDVKFRDYKWEKTSLAVPGAHQFRLVRLPRKFSCLCQDYKQAVRTSRLLCYTGVELWTLVLTLVWWVLYPLSHLLSPPMCYYFEPIHIRYFPFNLHHIFSTYLPYLVKNMETCSGVIVHTFNLGTLESRNRWFSVSSRPAWHGEFQSSQGYLVRA